MEILIIDKIPRIIKNKERLEKALNVKITNNGKEVSFEGEAEDEFVAGKVLEALDLGFSFSDAIKIKEEDLEFDTLNIKEFARRGNLEKVRGRLIGKNGKVLAALTQLTKCSLEIKGNTVGVIGNPEDMKKTIESIIQIIQGSKHANVYKGLEKRNEEPIVDWGLKKDNKNL